MLVFMYGKEGNSTSILSSLNSLHQPPRGGRAQRLKAKPCLIDRQNEELTLWSGILDFFPDLRNLSQNDLQPVLLTPRSHVRKKLMVGIPVAKRSKDYTVATLSSLFAELDDNYREDIVFLVMFATTEEQFIQNRTKEMEERFSDEISTGILECYVVCIHQRPRSGLLEFSCDGISGERADPQCTPTENRMFADVPAAGCILLLWAA
ncbi:hypothetical protein Y032_0713g1745 [Ancylostoma ceylanicum]|nr:hypothetical protein Y032_0713g1745 [Ancylostoma ceylanicum]